MNSQAKTENEPYTPTDEDVQYLYGSGYSGDYFEFYRWLAQHDAEVLAAARPLWEAESREALAQEYSKAIWMSQSRPLSKLDWLIDSGAVTLATPPEPDERLAKIEALIAPQWRSIAYDRNALIDDLRAIMKGTTLASRPAAVASQDDTPADEEMVYVGTPDGSGGYEIPAQELDAILRSKNVPVDALGFPTEVGATFRARFAGNPEDYTPHHFRVSEPGRFWLYSVGNYRRYHLNPASIEDVRPADERSEQ